MRVVPAILTPDIKDFDRQLHRLLPHFNRFSIDVQDGKFVTSQTVSTKQIKNFISGKDISPNVIFDFDLMTLDFNKSINDINEMSKHITIGSVFLHKALVWGSTLPKKHNLTIGLALNPPDTINDLSQFESLNSIKSIQVMTVHSGPQQQPFIPEMLHKIGELRNNNYRNDIFIDGGVNGTTIPLVLANKYKPDFACVGSYLSKAGDELEERVKYLKSIESVKEPG